MKYLKLNFIIVISFINGIRAIEFENKTGHNIYVRFKDGNRDVIEGPVKLRASGSGTWINLGNIYKTKQFPLYVRIWFEKDFNPNNPDDETKPTFKLSIDKWPEIVEHESLFFEKFKAKIKPNSFKIIQISPSGLNLKYERSNELDMEPKEEPYVTFEESTKASRKKLEKETQYSTGVLGK